MLFFRRMELSANLANNRFNDQFFGENHEWEILSELTLEQQTPS